MPTLTPASSGTLTFAPVTGVEYDGFYPSSTTYPSSSLYPGILSVGSTALSLFPPALLKNGDFEDGIQYWHEAHATITTDTTQFYQGSRSIKVVTENVVAAEGFDRSSAHPVTGQSDLLPISPSKAYTLSAYIYGDGVGTLRMIFDQYDSSFTLLTSTNSGIVTPPADWTQYTVSLTTQSTAAWMNIRFLTNVQQSFTFYVDQVDLTPANLILTPA